MANHKRYCAFCSAKRRVYLKRHAGGWDLLSAIVMGLLIMWARWQEIDFKAIVIVIAIFMTMEVIIQIRYRLNLVCQYCGFDPVLYRKNPGVAAQVVKKHLDKLKDDPNFLLSEKAQSVLKRLKRVRRSKSEFEIEA